MVRFSCFSIPVEDQKPKKGQHSGVAMQLNSQKSSQDQLAKFPPRSASSNPKIDGNNLSSTSAEQITSPSSHEGCWKSDDLNANFSPDGSKEVLQMLQIKKCQSLGNILDKEKGFSYGEATEDGFSFDYSHEKGMKRVNASLNHADSAEFFEHEHLERNFYSEHPENNGIESFDLIADQMHNKSLFSIEVLKQFDVEQNADIDEQSADHVADSGGMSSDNFPIFARSRSVANLRMDSANATEDGPDPDWMGLRSRSFEHLHSLAEGRAELLSYDDDVTLHRHRPVSNSRNMLQASGMDVNGSPYHVDLREEPLVSNKSDRSIEDLERDGKYWSGEFSFDSKPNEEQDFRNYNGSTNYAGEPENDVVIRKDLRQESPIQNWDELSPKELSMKRIEEWISQIDIENSIVQEVGESSNPSTEEPRNVADVVTTKPDGRSNLGMEVAYNYISSLSATSSSAQMANLGLAALPILSAFVSLRVLNLSGNSIVRITAGALPRGLHMLNLSKNNIATIEGLRDLTRLRVLDLSYNRIVRIGHGLASCSSLKELYLAGNKISEVEGLHRLLKLSILDLRLNKISTAKGLGQLAANYGSLQAINLEGNPAQRNVGDEQLKKYLLSLLPNLVYYNKHAIKASSSKEVADRPRDRGLRSEHKIPRMGSHGSGLHKLSSTHGRSGLGLSSLLKQSKSKNVRLPPVAKPTNLLPDISRKLLSLEPSSHIRRSLSEERL